MKVPLTGRTQDMTQLTREIALQPDIEIVGESIDPVEVLLTAKSGEADVVVISVKDSGDPGLVSHLLSEMPNLMVLMASSTDKLAYVVQLGPQRK